MASKKKVLFLTNIPSPYRVSFFTELGKKCELTVLYEMEYAGDRNSKWLSEKGCHYKAVFMKALKKFTSSALCPEVICYLRNSKFDFIIVGGYSTPTGMLAILYLYYKKIPFLLNCDGGQVKQDTGIKRWLKKFFISKAAYWLSPGKVCDEYLISYGADKVRILRYLFTSLMDSEISKTCYDEAVTATIRQELKIKEKMVFISVGSFIYRKGYDLLLKAAAELSPDCGIYIIGGKPTKEYKKLVLDLNLSHVHFIDFIEKKQLAKYYMASDVFVLPTREDVWGLVINEAMAYGLPIITTNKCVAGLELVENGRNGFIIETENIHELSAAMQKFNTEHLLSKQMGLESLNRIKAYTIENMAERHMEIMNGIKK